MPRRVLCVMSCLVVGVLSASSSGGDLDPPAGPVAATMKTLAEVEPRIPLTQETAPTDGSSVHVITAPGSYYLTGDIEVPAGMSAIFIDDPAGPMTARAGVELDLNGFTIRHASGSNDVIESASYGRLVVRNGHVAGVWSNNVLSINTGPPGAVVLRDLTIQAEGAPGAGAQGVFVVADSLTMERVSFWNVQQPVIASVATVLIADCEIVSSGNSAGIELNDNSPVGGGVSGEVRGCSLVDTEGILVNTGDSQVRVAGCTLAGPDSRILAPGGTVEGCVVRNQTGTSGNVEAIECSEAIRCVVEGFDTGFLVGSAHGCSAVGCGVGFNTQTGGAFVDCVATRTQSIGLRAQVSGDDAPVRVVGCSFRGDPSVTAAIGIDVIGADSVVLIEGCQVQDFGRGISLGGVPSAVIRGCLFDSMAGDGISGEDSVAVVDTRIREVGGLGVRLANGARVERCVIDTASNGGIELGNDAWVSGCEIRNVGGRGIEFGGDARCVDTTIRETLDDGINGGSDASLERVVVDAPGREAIRLGDNARVIDCRVDMGFNTQFDGVFVGPRSEVLGCDVRGIQGQTRRGIGAGSLSRLEDNLVSQFATGYETGGSSLVVGNRAAACTIGYSLMATDASTPIVSGAAAIQTNTNAAANLEY